MKQTLHTSRRAIRLALLCLMAFVTWGGNYCIAQETAYKTLSFPDDNKNNNKLSAYDKSWIAKIGDFSWKITNFNNNNWSWTHIRAGREKVASVATIDNTTPFDKAIGKIVVDVLQDVDAGLVNSICLQVASDAGFSNVIETIELKSYKKTDFVFNVSAPQANLYYRLKFNLKEGSTKKKKNGFVQINKVEYFEDASNKTATSLSFDVPSYTISKDQKYQQLPTLKAGETVIEGKTITWSSDNENVATVDENGTVTGVAAGNANITAKFAGDDEYETSTASYEIIVKGAPALSFSQTSYMIEMGDAFSEPTLQGLPTGVTAKYSSSNADVATVDESTGKVQIVGVGTTTIKAVSEAKDVYEAAEASYELTVNRASSKKVEFDLSTFGFENGKEVTGVKLEGITMTFDANSGISPKWYTTGNAVRFYANNILTISSVSRIKSVEFICSPEKETEKVKYIASENTKLSAGVYNNKNHTWDLSGTNEKVITLKNTLSSGHFRIQKIIVTTELPTSVGTISIATPEGFGTYYNSNSYILPEGLTAFGYTKANTDGTLVKTDVFNGGDVVPANVALVVKGNTGDYECYATDQVATKTLEGNLLKGVAKATTVEKKEGFKRYVLTKVNGVLGFYQTQSGNIKVPANRAYLELTEAQAQAVSFFQLDGETTGIENATATTKEAPKAIYTLSGVRLKATTTKGLPAGAYVVNGKVVIVK